ncbi:MAG: glycine cleavage system protein GcvH [Sedimentisphaerales bacterium]|nr:glycine cleavage system protein GcvH [Sedimentisphaerales bacterium]
MVVKGLLYTKEHEWAKVDGDVAAIGITDHAQDQLGELTFIELPEVGKEVKQNGQLGAAESSKAASDVYSPVSGSITEVNEELKSKPELVNKDCYGAGWICKIRLTDKDSLKNLMDAGQYEEYLKGL